jgi:hypothetical protein
MSDKPPAKMAKAGMKLLKRLVFDQTGAGAGGLGGAEAGPETPKERRDALRTPVVGEVDVVALDPAGQPVGHTKVFIRDLSPTGCGLWSRARLSPGVGIIIHFPACNGQPPLARFAVVSHCRGQDGSGFAVGCRFDAESKNGAA